MSRHSSCPNSQKPLQKEEKDKPLFHLHLPKLKTFKQEKKMSISLDFCSSISLSRNLSFLPPISSPLPITLSPPSSLHNLSLSLSVPQSRRWNLRRRCLRPPDGEFSGNVESDEEVLELEDAEESDVEEVDAEGFEIEELEREAKAAARDYSLSLSRELTIGVFSSKLT